MSNSTSATLLAAPPQHHEHLQQQLAQSWDCDLSKLGIDSCNRKNLLKNTPLMQKIMATVAESHISLDSQHARHIGALLVKLASFSSSNPFLSTCHYHTSMALGSPSSSSPSSSSATTPLGTAILTTTTTSTTTATTSTTLPFPTIPTSTSSKGVKPSSLLHPSSSVSKQQQQPSSLSSTPPTATFRALLATLIGNGKLTKPLQLDEAVKYLKALHQRHLQLHPQQLLLSQPLLSAEQQDGLVSSSSSSLPSHSLPLPIVASINLNVQEFEQQCGIGLNFSEDDIRKHLYNYIRDHRREITECLMQHQPQQNNNNNNNEAQQSSSTACIAKLIGKMKQQLQQEQVNNNNNNNNNIALGQVLKWADFNVVSSILRELIIERECANSSPIEHDSNSNNSNNSSNNNNGNSYYNNSRRLLNQGNSVVPPPLQISSAAPVQQQDVELLQEEEEGNNQNHQDLPLPPPLPSSSSSSRTNSSPQNFALRLQQQQQQQQQQQNACSNTILSSGSSFSNQYHGKRRNSQAPPSAAAAASAQPRPNYGRKFSFVRELDTAVNFSSAGGSSAHHSSFHNFQYFANSSGSCEQLLQQQQQPQHIITRFPPEPNGFLHLGHAKAMHLNFSFAQSTTNTVPTPPSSSSSSFSLPSSTATDQQLTEAASGASLAATSVITTDNTAHQQASDISSSSNNSGSGETILRFDDTNPEVEDINFVNSIKEMCDWMGYKYSHITYTSQYFDQIYERAKMLIERERAYVDLSDRTVITMLRNKGEPSPYRDKFTVQENLKLFEDMKHGKYEEGAAVLRLKIDYKHCNLNMRDPIAYRIKFVPHFKEGNKWCIYPTYDFSHCIVDSLERITHSLCTMEFEVRRDLYYWILTALDNMYKPHVWEFSRLNVTNSVMSKRTMSDLVKRGIVRGWDDPRLLTLAGLKRRGYTPTSIKKFCDMIGVSRNENLIPLERLEQCLRDEMLHQQQQHRAQPQLQDDGTSTATAIATCTRAFCVREPLKVVLENVPENYIENFFMHYCEQRPELGSRALPFSRVIYIERRDFKEHDEEGFYGLALNKFVRLRLAAYPIKCTRVIREEEAGDSGKIIELRAIVDFERKEHPRGTIHWLGQDANGKDPMRAELRLYEPLFIEQSSAAAPKLPVAPSAAASVFENVDGEHSSLVINKNSLTIVRDAFVDPLFANRALRCKPYEKYQFERQGIFSVDPDTTDSLLVLNRTVSAKESYHKFS